MGRAAVALSGRGLGEEIGECVLQFEESVCCVSALGSAVFSLCGPGKVVWSRSHTLRCTGCLPHLGEFAGCPFMFYVWLMSKGRDELIPFIIGCCLSKVLVPNASVRTEVGVWKDYKF